ASSFSDPRAMPAVADRRVENPQQRRIQRSLSASWKEGVTSQFMLGILDNYLVPFALMLGATSRQIGLLAAIPNLMSSVSQFFAVKAVHAAGNRRRLLLWVLTLQFVFLLPIAF